MSKNDLVWPDSLWKATAEPLADLDKLPGDIDTDLLIIGAGYTGLSAHEIFGSPDDMKLKSSMTLFAHVSPEGSAFEQVLDGYFGGLRDEKTLELIRGGR